jgi:hypothetical protein
VSDLHIYTHYLSLQDDADAKEDRSALLQEALDVAQDPEVQLPEHEKRVRKPAMVRM